MRRSVLFFSLAVIALGWTGFGARAAVFDAKTGATIAASSDAEAYDEIEPNQRQWGEYQDFGHTYFHSCRVRARCIKIRFSRELHASSLAMFIAVPGSPFSGLVQSMAAAD